MCLGAQTLTFFAISSEEYSTDPVDLTQTTGIDASASVVESPTLVFVEFKTFNNVFKIPPRGTKWVL